MFTQTNSKVNWRTDVNAAARDFFATHKLPTKFNVTKAAMHIITQFRAIFDKIDKSYDIENLQYIVNNYKHYFSQTVHEYYVFEQACDDALEYTANCKYMSTYSAHIVNVIDVAEFEEIRDEYYNKVYDKLANKVDNLVADIVLMHAVNRLKKLTK